MNFISKILLVVLLAGSSFAHGAQGYKPPNFAAYPATEAYQGKPARLDRKSHSYARIYRQVLSGELESGPNFAGHFVIASWGCGTSCLANAIVDANTGKVFVPKVIESSGMKFTCDLKPLVFSRKSRLIVQLVWDVDQVFVNHLLWDGNRLRKLKSETHSEADVCRVHGRK